MGELKIRSTLVRTGSPDQGPIVLFPERPHQAFNTVLFSIAGLLSTLYCCGGVLKDHEILFEGVSGPALFINDDSDFRCK